MQQNTIKRNVSPSSLIHSTTSSNDASHQNDDEISHKQIQPRFSNYSNLFRLFKYFSFYETITKPPRFDFQTIVRCIIAFFLLFLFILTFINILSKFQTNENELTQKNISSNSNINSNTNIELKSKQSVAEAMKNNYRLYAMAQSQSQSIITIPFSSNSSHIIKPIVPYSPLLFYTSLHEDGSVSGLNPVNISDFPQWSINTIRTIQKQYREVLDPIMKNVKDIVLFDFPNHPNRGDSAIWWGEVAYLHSQDVSIASIVSYRHFEKLTGVLQMLDSSTTVGMMNGGGNFGGFCYFCFLFLYFIFDLLYVLILISIIISFRFFIDNLFILFIYSLLLYLFRSLWTPSSCKRKTSQTKSQ